VSFTLERDLSFDFTSANWETLPVQIVSGFHQMANVLCINHCRAHGRVLTLRDLLYGSLKVAVRFFNRQYQIDVGPAGKQLFQGGQFRMVAAL
jgi:hypothetical protein